MTTESYWTVDGTMAEARVYSVARDNSMLRMMVVDLSAIDSDENAVLDHAVQMLAETSEIKQYIALRISRVFGRQFSVARLDGSHSSVAVFYHRRRLYQIEGTAFPWGPDATSDAIRFQQSLVFLDSRPTRAPRQRSFQARRGVLRFDDPGLRPFPAISIIP